MFNLNKANQAINKNIDIEAYFIGDLKQEQIENLKKYIVPASSKREWMDEKHQSYAYYCYPMVAANQAGYWVLYNNDTEIFWNGGNNVSDVKIIHKDNQDILNTCSSHFSSGIITFNFPIVFKTPPGWGLWISGCPNYPINNLQALEAIVETNWLPFTFTMNYKITEKNRLIKLKKGMPICKMIPYPLNLNEKTNLKFDKLENNKKLYNQYNDWSQSRSEFNKTMKNRKTNERQFFYRDGINSNNENIADGYHKLNYKFEGDNKSIQKCPFLKLFNKV
jgi:hypothetical protein